jgi:hypothetical protein
MPSGASTAGREAAWADRGDKIRENTARKANRVRLTGESLVWWL